LCIFSFASVPGKLSVVDHILLACQNASPSSLALSLIRVDVCLAVSLSYFITPFIPIEPSAFLLLVPLIISKKLAFNACLSVATSCPADFSIV